MTFDRQSNGRRIEIESKSNRSRIVVVTTAFLELDGCNIDKQCELPMTLSFSGGSRISGKAGGGRRVAEGHEGWCVATGVGSGEGLYPSPEKKNEKEIEILILKLRILMYSG